jgi:hypothetical protein
MIKNFANKFNFSFFETDALGISDKITGHFDYGMSNVPITDIVSGKIGSDNLYVFQCFGPRISLNRTWLTTAWFVFLLESQDKNISDFLLYHKTTEFGELKNFKYIHENLDWKQITSIDLPDKNYKLFSASNQIERELNEKMINAIFECAKRFNKSFSTVPRRITFQKRGAYLAVYADQSSFDNIKELSDCLEYVRRINDIMKETR